jgi:hypothetical protein
MESSILMEAAYCKALAIKLDFIPDVVDYYSQSEFPNLEDFKNEVLRWNKNV